MVLVCVCVCVCALSVLAREVNSIKVIAFCYCECLVELDNDQMCLAWCRYANIRRWTDCEFRQFLYRVCSLRSHASSV